MVQSSSRRRRSAVRALTLIPGLALFTGCMPAPLPGPGPGIQPGVSVIARFLPPTNLQPPPAKPGGDPGLAGVAPDGKTPGGGAGDPGGNPGNDTARLQSEIAKEANQILGEVPFPYAAGTEGGVLGCAQVVSTILKRAGVVPRVDLAVLRVMDMLKAKGWAFVKPPPWKDGDVVTWQTYDRTGDGKDDPDTHIGVVVKEGGSTFAVNNSSSKRRPVKVPINAYSYPISHVLRMPGA